MGIEIIAGSEEHAILKTLYQSFLEKHAYLLSQYLECGHGDSHYLKELSAIASVMRFELKCLEHGRPANVSQFMLSFGESELKRAEDGFLRYFAEDHPGYSSKS
jgi:hypothetical protein